MSIPQSAEIRAPGGVTSVSHALARANRRVRWQRGVTLLESMIALAIFSYALAALSTLMISSMRSNNNAKRYTMASSLAQAKIEDLRAAGYAAAASSPSAEALNMIGGTGGATMYNRSWVVTAGTPVAKTKTMAVTVDWNDNQGSHTAVVKTILAN